MGISPRLATLALLLAIFGAAPISSKASPLLQERPQPKPKVDLEVQISFEFRTRNELMQGVWPTTKRSTNSPTEGILYVFLDTRGTTNEVSGVKFKIRTPQNLKFSANYLQDPYFFINGIGQTYDFFAGAQFIVNTLVKEEGERRLIPGQAIGENRAPIGALNYQFNTDKPSSIGTFTLEYSQVFDKNGNLVPHSIIPQTVVNIPFNDRLISSPKIIQDKYYDTKGRQVYSLTVSSSLEDSQLSALQTSTNLSQDSDWQYLGQHGPETWPGSYYHYDGFNIQFRSDSPAQFFRLVPAR